MFNWSINSKNSGTIIASNLIASLEDTSACITLCPKNSTSIPTPLCWSIQNIAFEMVQRGET